MKRFGLWILFGCLLLCGCAKDTALPQTTSFSSTVTITANDVSVTATLTRTERGQLTLVCTAPERLSGVTVALSGETVRFSKGGLSREFPLADVPKSAVFSELCRVLDAAAQCTEPPKSGVLQGVCNAEPYTLTFDEKTGVLQSISVPNADFSVVFSDFSPDL